MFVYKGTKESLNNEVLTIEAWKIFGRGLRSCLEVLKEAGGSFQPQGKAWLLEKRSYNAPPLTFSVFLSPNGTEIKGFTHLRLF